jgi:hypothetical protein
VGQKLEEIIHRDDSNWPLMGIENDEAVNAMVQHSSG